MLANPDDLRDDPLDPRRDAQPGVDRTREAPPRGPHAAHRSDREGRA